MKRFSPLSPDIAPLVTWLDAWNSACLLLQPWRWRSMRSARIQKAMQVCEHFFRELFSGADVLFFAQGRDALLVLLQALKFPRGFSVVVQALTCVIVPNAVIKAGGTPLFIDIDETYNIDPQLLEGVLQKGRDVRAVIVQHTFGIPANIVQIQKICRRYGVTLIEDCAHALGATIEGKPVGSFGDAAIFSFGREKVISTVSGGAVITKDTALAAALRQAWQTTALPSTWWILQRLWYPVIMVFARKTYYFFSLGKIIIWAVRLLHLLPLATSHAERQGHAPLPHRFPPLFALALHKQCANLSRANSIRRGHAKEYFERLAEIPQIVRPLPAMKDGAIFLRFPIEVSSPHSLSAAAACQHILLGNWYHHVVDPSGTNCDRIGYIIGSCPRAEFAAAHIMNLPTQPTLTIEERSAIISFLKY